MESKCLKILYKKGVASRTRSGEIASELGIPSSTATDLVKRMYTKDLVNYEKYYGVSLTPKGQERAEQLFRNHRLLEVLFVREFSLTASEACNISNGMDKHLPVELADVICKKYTHPDTCPCGKELLSNEGCCTR